MSCQNSYKTLTDRERAEIYFKKEAQRRAMATLTKLDNHFQAASKQPETVQLGFNF
jgi:hypothetical protein